MDVWDRIKAVMNEGTFATEAEWLAKAGLSNGYFSSSRAGKKDGRRGTLGMKALQGLSTAAGVRLEWLAYGTGPMREGQPDEVSQVEEPAPSSRPEGIPLMGALSRLEPAGLRIALTEFYAQRMNDPRAISVVEEFLTRRHRAESVKTEEQWMAEIKTAYQSRKKLYETPFGLGAKRL